MCAIINKKTGKWLYGTDRSFRDGKPRQRTSYNQAMTWEPRTSAEMELRFRRCGKCYEAVPVKLVMDED